MEVSRWEIDCINPFAFDVVETRVVSTTVINWKKVKNDDINFAFIRLGFRGYESGKIVLDSKFEQNIEGSIKAGIDTGVYFFTEALTEEEAVEEAEFVIENLKDYISNSFCALCGQSAVGKSSIINALIPNMSLMTQGLSAKIERGKHTTRANEIYFSNNIMITDTPGFSSLELDIDYQELAGFYPEFAESIGDCKYLDCAHIKEGKDCVIVTKVEEGKVNKDRYLRYVELYEKLKKNWDEKYD